MSTTDQDDGDTRPEGRRERKKQATRRAIHAAAYRLVDEHGLEATTIDQISEAADISPRTFFNYFPSKAAAALNLPETMLEEESVLAFRAAQGELVPAICRLVGAAGDAGDERRRMKELLLRRPELLPAFMQWMGSMRTQLVELVEERVDSADAMTAVALVMTAVNLLAHDSSAPDQLGSERLLEAVDRLVAARAWPLQTR